MIERCENPNCPTYRNYGARGIKVCEAWRNDFTAFCKWARKNGYEHGLTIDRIDNDKGYSPENCRWADWKTQARNRRNTVMIEYQGKTKSRTEWAEIMGLKPRTLAKRLESGWSVEDALTTPLDESKSSRRVATPREVAKALKMSLKSIYEMLESGELDGYRVGNYWKVPEKSVNRYIKKQVEKERRSR